jgi:hypothetical protein
LVAGFFVGSKEVATPLRWEHCWQLGRAKLLWCQMWDPLEDLVATMFQDVLRCSKSYLADTPRFLACSCEYSVLNVLKNNAER